jgi:PIN domain nuclease of toxin-antitoxin system
VKSVLLDTYSWAWSLAGDPRLSDRATAAILRAETVLVSPISFFEIGQKVRLGKWPEMLPFVADLPALLERQGGVSAGLDQGICLRAALMDWTHRDPFDRILAATAERYGVVIISADGVVTRVW